MKQGLRAIRHPKRVAKLAGRQPYILVTAGPLEYSRYLRRAISSKAFSHKFPNGITTSIDSGSARNWYMLKKKPLVIVLFGEISSDETQYVREWVLIFKRHPVNFLLAPGIYEDLASDIKAMGRRAKLGPPLQSPEASSFYDLQQELLRTYAQHDTLLLDVTNELPDIRQVIQLEHVAHTYSLETGIATPALFDEANDTQVSGVNYSYETSSFEQNSVTGTDYGQLHIPRYGLTAYAHGMYVSAMTLQQVQPTRTELKGMSFANQISIFVGKAWQQNIRHITYSPVVLRVSDLPQLDMTSFHTAWLTKRKITDSDGRIKVIYVLNATSISGGIRTVFEHINGLKRRNFAVELWSLEGQPDWTDLNVSVRRFRSYADIELSLRSEEAIKVATWWETAQPVWIASVNNGIPAFFIQEFETWFYSDDVVARAAVVSSYRPEFRTMTIAQYNFDELHAIGLNPPIIPVGYEKQYYYPMPLVKRLDNTVLAVGRSFFQKNFSMTLAGWRGMGRDRPELSLFGSEPNIVSDKKVTYYFRPTNAEVNKLYNQATVFVQTSRHEGFCLPIIEAMAAGCPVICTDSHGNRDFCIDGETCLIVGHDDVAGLTTALERLLSDPALRAKLSRNGLRMAQKYEWSNILDDVALFYSNLLS